MCRRRFRRAIRSPVRLVGFFSPSTRRSGRNVTDKLVVSFEAGVPIVDAFCIPKGVTMGQMIAVVVKYVDEHPEDMHSEFLFLAHEALLTAWPCKP
jgi:hypothetical protein